MKKEDVFSRCLVLSLDDVRYYTASPSLSIGAALKWQRGILDSVKNETIPFSNMNTFVQVIAYYNKNIY